MFARPEFLLFALGILVAVVGAAVLDLWLLAASCRSLFRRDPLWGVFGVLLGLLILGGIALYSGLLYQLLLTVVAT